MRKIIGILGFVYIISAIVLVPVLLLTAWKVLFPPPYLDFGVALLAIAKIVAWLVMGLAGLTLLKRRSLDSLFSKVRSVAPGNYKPSFELIGDYLTEYLGLAPAQNLVVVVDVKQGIIHSAPTGFLQGWSIDELGSRTTLVLRFSDSSVPAIRFDIPRRSSDAIAAKLTSLA